MTPNNPMRQARSLSFYKWGNEGPKGLNNLMYVTEPLRGRAGISTQVNWLWNPFAHTVPSRMGSCRPSPAPQRGLRAYNPFSPCFRLTGIARWRTFHLTLALSVCRAAMQQTQSSEHCKMLTSDTFCFIGKWLNQRGQKAQELYYNMLKCVIILISLKSLKRLSSIRP